MSTTFRHHLVFKLDCGHTSTLIGLYQAHYVQLTAIAIVTIGNHGHSTGSRDDLSRSFHHFRCRHQADIGFAQEAGGNAKARHIQRLKACLARNQGRKTIIDAGQYQVVCVIHQLFQHRFTHKTLVEYYHYTAGSSTLRSGAQRASPTNY